MRALATATISFGLVSIPVKLFASTESSQAVRFNQIHKKDGARLKQQMISASTGEPVPKDEIVKGYEFARGQYVLFTPEELKAIEATANYTIDIAEFVPAGDIERMYLDKAYFLGPDKGGARAYRLLSAALRKTGRAAIARYAARGKQYLVMVRPKDDGLVMEQLHYPAELRSFSEVPIEDVEVKEEEIQLALQLIDQSSAKVFDPDNYRDDVRARMLELIQRKAEGEDITVTPTEEPEHKIIDLMEALKQSIASGGKAGKAERKPARRAASSAGAARKKRATRKASGAK